MLFIRLWRVTFVQLEGKEMQGKYQLLNEASKRAQDH